MIKPEDLRVGTEIMYRDGTKGTVIENTGFGEYPIRSQTAAVKNLRPSHTSDGRNLNDSNRPLLKKDIVGLWEKSEEPVESLEVIAQEDDCAPDARKTFSRRLKELTGKSESDFMVEGIKLHTKDDAFVGYRIGNYQIRCFADDPFYVLEEVLSESAGKTVAKHLVSEGKS